MKYVKRSFMAGREFRHLVDAARQLEHWVCEEASQRIHGTTRERPLTRCGGRFHRTLSDIRPTEETPMHPPMPELAPLLKRLRSSGVLHSLEERNREAIETKIGNTDFLALLIQDEVARRNQKKFDLRMRRAGFRSSKTLEAFDFDFNPRHPGS